MSSSQAPARLVTWWRTHKNASPGFPFEISFHHRSDGHSRALAEYVLDDLLATSAPLRRHIETGVVCASVHELVADRYRVQRRYELVVGPPHVGEDLVTHVRPSEIRVALKLKTCMTNFNAARVRLRNELASAARCVIEQSPTAIVGALVVVNTSPTYVSPTDQLDPLPATTAALERRQHRQPRAAASVIDMLQRLPPRDSDSLTGLDAVSTICVHHDNELPNPTVALSSDASEMEARSYAEFVSALCDKYDQRFA